MNNKFINIIIIICTLSILGMPINTNAEDFRRDNESDISYNGNTIITDSQTISDKKYSSLTGGENALLVSGGSSIISNIYITKNGDEEGETSDFYGTNAGILVYNSATLTLNGGNILTSGKHSNGLFVYGTGIVEANELNIKTSNDNSGGIMVAGGGIINAKNLNVETSGNSSASIRSDRGGGKIQVSSGTYKTSGVGSPAIYSTANIEVKDSKLISESSEGVVVEGNNSVTLENVSLTDTNNTLNGNSETYKNIFLYQSMSGDATVGESTFIANNSDIITNKGDTFYVTNTSAKIELTNNVFTNNDGAFLRAEAAKWGNANNNGGNVEIKLTNQKVDGNIIIDNISSLDMSINSNSELHGYINKDNQSQNINISLDNNSVWILEDDSYITSLNNNKSDNSNIYLNGHKLYVNGISVSANNNVYSDEEENKNEENVDNNTNTENTETKKTSFNFDSNFFYQIGIAAGVLFILILIIIIMSRKKDPKEEIVQHDITTNKVLQENIITKDDNEKKEN